MRARSVRAFLLCIAFAAMTAVAPSARARGGDEAAHAPNGIRDAEIEADIRTMATPIWRAAGLDPNQVGIYLIADNHINSFVAGGQAIFINTGLIEAAQTPDQLIGVIAHETGHIIGGDALRLKQEMHNVSIETIIAMVAGGLAGAFGHSGAPLIAAAGVGQQAFLHFSVAQEATADHTALNLLDRACISARGLLKFFEILKSQELLNGDRPDEWTETHPLTSQRIEYVRNHVAHARCSNAPERPAWVAMLNRIHAKLHAFLDPPSETLADYPKSDHSETARYARAIAYYRIPDLARAVPAIDALIRDYPKNPYYRELKGQMLFENGHVRAAIRPYEEAVRLAPDQPLLRIELSQVYIESGDPALDKRAIGYLNDASLGPEGRNSELWHFLAVAYGRNHQIGMAALSLAEEALVNGKKTDALQEASRARHLLARNTSPYYRAEEITREAKQLDE